MSQNIFDNPAFFSGYMELRAGLNYNDLLELPEMKKLLPPLSGKRILDLGCGFGKMEEYFVKNGAFDVTAVDISEKMIGEAVEKHSYSNVRYVRKDISNLDLEGEYDIVYSSLVFHYIKDFEKLMKQIDSLMKKDGILLFSQEHPLTTATLDHRGHFDDYNHFVFGDYQMEGKRKGTWFVENVENYHRTLSHIISTVSSFFRIEKVVEPVPSEDALRLMPRMERDFIRPTFLIVKASKS